MSFHARLLVSALVFLTAAGPCFAAGQTGAAPSAGADKHTKHRGMAPTMAWVDADVEPRAVLLCIHGLGLHNSSYKAFGERMAKQGIATYAVDVRGFGSWQRKAGHEDVNFDECLDDVRDTLKVIRRAHSGLPVFLLGESMGGAIALRATERYPQLVDGLISCVPSGDRFGQAKTDLTVAIRLLQGANKKFDIGSHVVKQASKSQSGEVNAELQTNWLENQLNRKELSPKELIQFQRFMNENHESAKKITDKPVLIVQGWDDNLVKAQGTLTLWEELGTNDKDFLALWGAKHLIFEESQFNDPALNAKADRMVVRWMDDHIKKPLNADKQKAAQLN
jgi:alpha-beta hydrolase superfamily lysophospholipase